MSNESQGPEGWEAEDYDREKIRELRDKGMDPASVQQKLKDMGHPSARNLGTDARGGDVEAPVSGAGGDASDVPGGEERDMVARGKPTGGENRPQEQASDPEGR